MAFGSKNNLGGFPGGMNMSNLMKQAKKMQEDMKKTQEELAQKTFEITSGGGAIKLIIDGQKHVQSIEISKEVVDPDDLEMLQDLIISAVNEGIRQADEAAANSMGKLTGGIGPSLF